MPNPQLQQPQQQSRDLVAEEIRTDVDERSVVARINTDHLDRYKTVILPGGAKLDNYRKNPVVLWAHDYRSPPIGRNLWIKADEHALIAKTVFADTALANDVLKLYGGGFLKAFSIGFSVPRDGASEPTEDELKERPDWAGATEIYRKWELLEYSCVPVPGNADAVVLAMESQQLELCEPVLRAFGLDPASEAARQALAAGGKQLEEELTRLHQRMDQLELRPRKPSEQEVQQAVTNLIKDTQLGSLLQQIDLKRLISTAVGEVVAKLKGRV